MLTLFLALLSLSGSSSLHFTAGMVLLGIVWMAVVWLSPPPAILVLIALIAFKPVGSDRGGATS